MAAGSHTERKTRGAALLLEHLAEPARRPPARGRLAMRIGDELARFLVYALTGDYRARGRWRAWRRGSSSP